MKLPHLYCGCEHYKCATILTKCLASVPLFNNRLCYFCGEVPISLPSLIIAFAGYKARCVSNDCDHDSDFRLNSKGTKCDVYKNICYSPLSGGEMISIILAIIFAILLVFMLCWCICVVCPEDCLQTNREEPTGQEQINQIRQRNTCAQQTQLASIATRQAQAPTVNAQFSPLDDAPPSYEVALMILKGERLENAANSEASESQNQINNV